MLNLRQLIESTRILQSRLYQVGNFSITRLAPVPMTGAFAVQARFQSLTDPHLRYYDTTIILFDLEYVETRDGNHPLSVEVTPGKYLYFPRPQMSRNGAAVTCQCSDFYFRWKFALDRAGNLGFDYWHGIVYRRRTPPPPIGRPYQNPNNVPGCCKHIINLARRMQQAGFLNA